MANVIIPFIYYETALMDSIGYVGDIAQTDQSLFMIDLGQRLNVWHDNITYNSLEYKRVSCTNYLVEENYSIEESSYIGNISLLESILVNPDDSVDTGEPFVLLQSKCIMDDSTTIYLLLGITNDTESNIHHFTVYIPPSEDEVILAENVIEYFENDAVSGMMGILDTSVSYNLIPEYTYKVTIDDETYKCVAKTYAVPFGDVTLYILGLGNGAIMTNIDCEYSGEPFLIACMDGEAMAMSSDTEATSHTVGIELLLENHVETDRVNILLYDRDGVKRTFESIDELVVDTPEAVKGATFIYGKTIDNVTYAPNFKFGNYTVSVLKGQFLKGFVIKKPETLLPENIVKDVNISGVVGSHESVSVIENYDVELNMSDGDQVVTATDGYAVKSAILKKPETLIPENIKKGIDIAGVVGTHESVEILENETLDLYMANGDQILSVPDGYAVKSAILKKPETLIPENIKNGIDIAGVNGSLLCIKNIATEAEMNELLVSDNVGNAYRFTGETTANYINGDIYVVEESE